jgi:dTDP-glucose 4,6-dehydratase
MLPVLVTGGCGFIGSNFIRYLLETDPDISIVNFDCLTYAGNLDNLSAMARDSRYRFVRGDIADHRAVGEVAEKGLSAIINFAAESHVDRSIHDSSPFIRTNILGTQVLLDVSRELNVPRYVQISTDEVYGSLGPAGVFTESTPLSPNSPYSASKAAADMLVRSYVHTFGVPAVITRCSNNYGPYQFPEKLLPLFIMNLLRSEPVPVYGDGLNIRDWIHVRDHCAAIDRVWRQGKVGEVYNIGGRCERTNLELTNALLEIMDKPRSLIRFVRDRPGHDRRYAMDSSKIEQELGWRPQIGFEEGLRETVDWYENHPEWVANIRSGEYLKYYEKQYGRRLSDGVARTKVAGLPANAKPRIARRKPPKSKMAGSKPKPSKIRRPAASNRPGKARSENQRR